MNSKILVSQFFGNAEVTVLTSDSDSIDSQIEIKSQNLTQYSSEWHTLIPLLPFVAPPLPLRIDAGGTIRIGKTRVTLQTLVGAFNRGATAEEIVQQFPTLDLAETYLAIGYYLQHRAEVDDYLRQQKVEAARIQAEVEGRSNPVGIRERLLARRQPK